MSGYNFTNKQDSIALDGRDGKEMGRTFDNVYNQIGGQIQGGIKIYKALIKQNAPTASQTSGVFIIGQLWTINDYVGGIATTKSNLFGGTGYTSDTGITTTGGTGTGLLVNYTAVGGVITSLTISDGGIGYTIGDTITVDDGNGDATFVVSAVASDDFSNMELINGTMNTSGAVIRATSTTPNTWTNGSDLSYDGAPYVVSTDANGNIAPFINTLGQDVTFFYIEPGVFYIDAVGVLSDITKVNLTICSQVPNIGYIGINNDGLQINLQSANASGVTSNNIISNTAFEIQVYP